MVDKPPTGQQEAFTDRLLGQGRRRRRRTEGPLEPGPQQGEDGDRKLQPGARRPPLFTKFPPDTD